MYAVNGTVDPATIDTTTTPAVRVDESRWTADNWPPHSVKMAGLFIPPETGEYRLCVSSTGNAKVYLSSDDNPSNMVSFKLSLLFFSE